MIEVKNNFGGGLDLDTDYYLVPKTSYVGALNIARDAIEGSHDNVITNIKGNRLANYNYPSAGTIINITPFTLRNTAIFFRYSPSGFNAIYEYNATTDVITKIFECLTDSATDILNFTLDGKITSVNIFPRDEEGDLLFFLDSLKRPTYLNITSFKAGLYTPVTRNIIDTAVDWPFDEPDCVYGNDATKATNYLTNKLFRFQQIWVGDDLWQTICSPVSAVPLPVNILDPTFTNVITNNNVISISLDSGGKNVKSIKLLMSYVEKSNDWSDFQEVITIDKATQSIPDDTPFNYLFYNDSTYPLYDVARRIETQSYVPLAAQAQEMPNGNVLLFGNITEGYDNDLVPNVTLTILTQAAGTGIVIGTLNGIISSGGFHTDIAFTGIPAVGTVVVFKLKRNADGVTVIVSTYTTILGDTATEVAQGLINNIVAPSVIGSILTPGTARFSYVIYNTPTLEITTPTSSADDNSIATWPFLTQRTIGLIYFDQKGRTNGVVYNAQVIFPAYSENGSQQVLLPYINAKIFHVPPIWAYSYGWVMSKENTQYLYFETVDVNTTESGYVYFDITNLALNQQKNPTTAAVVNWTFQDGDRMRLIRRMSDATVFNQGFDSPIEGIVTNPTINNVLQNNKTFVKIKNVFPFNAVNYTSKFFVIQLYRPQQQQAPLTNLVFYEFGENYEILNPTTNTRIHAGQVTNQSTDYATPAEFNFYNGDSYFRVRTVYISQTGFGTFNVQDRNFVDFYISAVNSIDGRPFVIDPNAKQTTNPVLLRFSQAYQSGTNINGLSRFSGANFQECNLSYGGVMRLIVRDMLMKVFQHDKTGRIPLFNQISKDATGNEVLVQTDKLLNPIQYYVGNWGIGTADTSIASFNWADYFCDNIRGAICRSSYDGVDPLSIIYKTNSWANENLPLRKGTFKIYGAYDQKLNNYIAALEATEDSEAQTLVFSEEDKSFDGFLSFYPEAIGTLGTLLIAAKNGDIYIHDSSVYNNFFGVQYESNFIPIFNQSPLEKKSLLSITQSATPVWECPEIKTNVFSYGTTQQTTNLIKQEFRLLEGQYSSAVKRDSNSRGGKINGDFMKGNYALIKFKIDAADATELVTLNIVSLQYVDSPLISK